MSNTKRLITLGLLVIFGVLLSKNMFPSMHESNSAECDEFGHIHLYKLNLSHSSNPHHQVEQNDGDENCHAGKNIYSYSLFPIDLNDIINPIIPRLVFTDYTINYFQTPDLDPLRKPPRLS